MIFRFGLAAMVLAAVPALAADPGASDRMNADDLKGVVSDAAWVYSSPARWDRGDWLEAGAIAGVGVGLYAGVDVPARHAALRSRSRVADRFADVGRGFGDGLYTVPALAVAYLGGEAAKDAKLRRASLEAVEALAISGVAVTVVKTAAGRDRPYVDGRRGRWNGPSFSNDRYSFPSGHSSDAWSVAGVFAAEYGDHGWVPPAAYGLATLTSLSRIYNDQHWASDVFIGSALGWFAAQAVAKRRAGGSLALVPIHEDRAAGAEFVLLF